MEKKKVYIGVYKENNIESLFFQNGEDSYFDLKKKKNISVSEIDTTSLIHYSEVINCESNLKSDIIRLYDVDRVQKVSLNKVFIGNIFIVEEATVTTDYFQIGGNIDFVTETVYGVKDTNNKALVFSVDNYPDSRYSDLVDLENSVIYNGHTILQEGSFYISREPEHLVPVKTMLGICGETMEKGKLLQKYREYKNSK